MTSGVGGTVYSPVDVTVPGVIECRPVTAPEWVVLGLDLSKAAYRVGKWLLEEDPF